MLYGKLCAFSFPYLSLAELTVVTHPITTIHFYMYVNDIEFFI